MNKTLFAILALIATTLGSFGQVTNLLLINPGVPGVTAGEQMYTATLKINQNTIALSNAINSVILSSDTNSSNYAYSVFVTGSNFTYNSFIINSNAALVSSNLAYTLYVQGSNFTRSVSLGTNFFFYDATNSSLAISNNVCSRTVDVVHNFRSGIYPLSGIYSSLVGDPYTGAFPIRNATNFIVMGLGSVTFLITNCYGVPASAAPDTNQSGTIFNIINFKHIKFENLTFMWTNTPHSSTNGLVSTMINLQGTNCSDADFRFIKSYNNPHQGIGTLAGYSKNFKRINAYRCEFYDSGKTNDHTSLPYDGSDFYVYNNSTITECIFHGGVRMLEAEGVVGLIDAPFYGNTIISGNTFSCPYDQAMAIGNNHIAGNVIITDNIFINTNIITSSRPYGIWGILPRTTIANNHFQGFATALYFAPVASGTNETLQIVNNLWASNDTHVVLYDNGGSFSMRDVNISGNTFKRGISGALWLKGAYNTKIENNTFVENNGANGNIRVFATHASGSGIYDMTNCVIRFNTFQNTNTGTFYGIDWSVPAVGKTLLIEQNDIFQNITALIRDNNVSVTANLDATFAVNTFYTNVAHAVEIEGSHRLNGVGADAAQGVVIMVRSNNAWMPKFTQRAFASSGTPVSEVPFRFRVGARDMFCFTNITGATAPTNIVWRFD